MAQGKKRKRQKPGRFLNILILIIIALIVFEGTLLTNMFRKESIKKEIQPDSKSLTSAGTDGQGSSEAAPAQTEAQTDGPKYEVPDSPAVVKETEPAVDDSYFSDAVFVGDSRVEGFRNQSGITKGTFLTGVGMNAANIFTTPFITNESGNVTVYQALYESKYKKVYIMLGTNDLGEYNYDDFKEKYRICIGELKKILPDAVFYVMEIPYVEESKVTTGDYVNNTNIDRINQKILEICEENGYNYIAVNEALSNGGHSLPANATSDGVHMYDTYCKKWLNYLKNHYVERGTASKTEGDSSGKNPNAASSGTETQTEKESAASTGNGI